jgi:hypothetical protein
MGKEKKNSMQFSSSIKKENKKSQRTYCSYEKEHIVLMMKG